MAASTLHAGLGHGHERRDAALFRQRAPERRRALGRRLDALRRRDANGLVARLEAAQAHVDAARVRRELDRRLLRGLDAVRKHTVGHAAGLAVGRRRSVRDEGREW